MFKPMSPLPGFIIIAGPLAAVNWLLALCESGRKPRPRTTRVTVQSRHASEHCRRIATGFCEFDAHFRADVLADFPIGLYLLRRSSGTRLVRSHRRRGSGARLLERCASGELGRGRARARFELRRSDTERNARSLRHTGAVPRMAVEGPHPRRSADRTERIDRRRDIHHHAEWNLEWGCRERDRRPATPPLCAPAHDDRVAAAKVRMGRHSAQRQPIIMRTRSNIRVEARLAAARSTSVPARVTSAFSGKALDHFRQALLRWYDQHRRDLPWRATRDPYRIWLSEIMLQQTRVAAVLAAWSGLGYYRRARMLHRCAQQIAAQHAGCFPRDSEALLALPGIGRYTAAAIASIAFAEPVAVVDGTVER